MKILKNAILGSLALSGSPLWGMGPELMPEEIEPIEAPFPMPRMERPVVPGPEFSITDFGARRTGEQPGFKSTEAIHAAIEAANGAGGGAAVIPDGSWPRRPRGAPSTWTQTANRKKPSSKPQRNRSAI